MTGRSLLPEPPPTLLPAQPAITQQVADGVEPVEIATRHPAASVAWAALAESAMDGDRTIEAYAYARTGYHRGLDALRRNGWKGFGPVPWSHEPNRGFLRCVAVLARATAAIGELDEAHRCTELLRECDPEAAHLLG
ncbi:MAG: DUF3151 domain-containing protein [Geodermatophilaceae bacterium]|jgi:hypothetical protein|nr:DUF3151 domain-containing protein [Geodermatophilaceae bacterium]